MSCVSDRIMSCDLQGSVEAAVIFLGTSDRVRTIDNIFITGITGYRYRFV